MVDLASPSVGPGLWHAVVGWVVLGFYFLGWGRGQRLDFWAERW